MENTKTVKVNIGEELTIVDLSKLTQGFKSDIFLEKNVNGSLIEVNLKSFLGLITLQLRNGDQLKVRAVGEDSEEALDKVVELLS